MNLTHNSMRTENVEWVHITYNTDYSYQLWGSEGPDEESISVHPHMVMVPAEGCTLTIVPTHGRRYPSEGLDDWGFEGPKITGITKIRLTPSGLYIDDEDMYFPMLDGLFCFAGAFFGDISIDEVKGND